MNSILWTLAGFAALWMLCFGWALCVTASREDDLMEGYHAQHRHR